MDAAAIFQGRMSQVAKTPTYPPLALRNEVEGNVYTRFVVRADSSVSQVMAISGPALLAAAALATISTWRFSP